MFENIQTYLQIYLGALKNASGFPVFFGHAWTGQDILKVFLDICGYILT